MAPFWAAAGVTVLELAMVLKVIANVPSYRNFPQSTAVRVGKSVTLTCAFDGLSPNDVVNWHWYNPETEAKLHHISSGSNVAPEFSRFSVVGNSQSGEFNLLVRNARPEDEGNYRCSVFSVRETKDAKLTVVVPPPKAPTIVGDLTARTVGQGLALTCVSEGGRPLPQLHWFNGTRLHVIPAASQTTDNQKVSLDLVIPFLTRWDNGARLTCSADQGFPGVITPQNTSTRIKVLYPPVVRVPKMSFSVSEGGIANLSCSIDSNPPSVVIWRKISGSLPTFSETRGASLVITNVSSSDEGIYQCTARNDVQPDGLGTVTLDVIYAPLIKPTFEKEISVMLGKDLYSLNCQAEGNPAPHVRWRRKDVKIYFNNPLTFSKVGYLEEGFYECVASSRGFPEVTRETYLNVIGRPDVLSESSTVAVTGGDTVKLSCKIASDPPPEDISWVYRGREGEERRYRGGRVDDVEVKTMVGDRIQTELTIASATNANVGDYLCKAQNMFGSDQQEFRVEVTASQMVVVAVIAGSATIGMLLAILTAICIGLRKGWIGRDKKGREHSEAREDIDNGVRHKDEKERTVIELQHIKNKAPRPRPPPKVDRDVNPYSIGLTYSHLSEPAPAYSTVDTARIRRQDDTYTYSPRRSPYRDHVEELRGAVPKSSKYYNPPEPIWRMPEET
ncbi:irregular chiasm C-roughest protein-like isoform X1 [Branchiostoma floridae x Branchiostoma belcheri]